MSSHETNSLKIVNCWDTFD